MTGMERAGQAREGQLQDIAGKMTLQWHARTNTRQGQATRVRRMPIPGKGKAHDKAMRGMAWVGQIKWKDMQGQDR